MTPDSKPMAQHLQDDLNAVIDKYRSEGLTKSDAIGVLEIVKLDVWFEFQEDNIKDIALNP